MASRIRYTKNWLQRKATAFWQAIAHVAVRRLSYLIALDFPRTNPSRHVWAAQEVVRRVAYELGAPGVVVTQVNYDRHR